MINIFTLDFDSGFTTIFPSATVDIDVDNGDSFIWTERYGSLGEFELTSKNVDAFQSQLYENVLITHTATSQIMMCSTQEITVDADGNETIKITGFSLEGFLNYRAFMDPSTIPYPLPMEYLGTALDSWTLGGSYRPVKMRAALDACVTNNVGDVYASIPMWKFLTSVRNNGASLGAVTEKITLGYLYDVVVGYLAAGNWALSTELDLAAGEIHTIIHDGRDVRTSVVFSITNEDLVEPSYLWPGGTRNWAIARCKNNAFLIGRDGLGYTGFDARYVIVENVKVAESTSALDLSRINHDVLAAFKSTSGGVIVSTKISPSSMWKYKVDYGIGDLVTVQGKYGINQGMRVTEHILTVDNTGITGYPSLTAI